MCTSDTRIVVATNSTHVLKARTATPTIVGHGKVVLLVVGWPQTVHVPTQWLAVPYWHN